MKIVFFSHLFPSENEPSSGVFNHQRVRALEKLGHELIVIVPVCVTPPLKFLSPVPQPAKIRDFIEKVWFKKNSQKETSNNIHYIKWFPVPKKLLWSYQLEALHISINRKLSKIIEEFQPDLVITSVIHPEGSYAKYFKEKYKLPVLSIAEGSELLLYPQWYKGIERIVKIVNRYCDQVVFVSKEMRDIITKKYKIERSSIINNGYDDELFYYDPHGTKKNDLFQIISVGNLYHIKGHDLLLQAVKEIPDVSLTIIGSGDYYEKYLNFIKKNEMENRVSLLGYVAPEFLRNHYQSADFFCLPSRSESFGIAALEAMACGLPVISSNVGEMINIIKDGDNGYLAEVDSIKSLKNQIIKSKSTNWNHEKISTFVSGNYGWNIWADTFNHLIQNILWEKRNY